MHGRPTTRGDIKVTVGIPTFNRAHFLRESMASVLGQSHRDFRLLVCDNASQDDTSETVASFVDPRIDYVRSETNVGMVGNIDRIVELTDTEFLVVLPDDDILYPDYLRSAIDVLERYPSVGVVHSAFDLIDESSRVLERARMLLRADGPVTFESGDDYLERSMRSSWTICWPSALFRTCAIEEADGLREDEEPLSDFPLMMRIASKWDFACLAAPLVAFRMHADAATAELGSPMGVGYDLLDEQPRILYNQRRRFLDSTGLPAAQVERYRSVAERTLRDDTVRGLANKAGAGASWATTSRALARLIRGDPRTLLLPATWKLCAAHLGGRQAKRAALRLGAWVGGAAEP